MIQKKQTISDYILNWSISVYILVGGLVIYVSAKIGKKVVDFILEATTEKFIRSVEEKITNHIDPLKKDIKRVESRLTKEIIQYKKDHHGVIEKNEAVLLQVLERLEDRR